MSGTITLGGKTLASHSNDTDKTTLTADEANVGSNALVVDSSGNVGIGTSSLDGILHISKNDVTSYNATATDGQVGVGPTIYLENPANNNSTVGGQIVFGMRSTEEQCRIGATGGTAPSLVFGTDDAERMRINSSGSIIFTTRGLSIESDGNGDPRIRADSNPITILAGSSNGVKLALNAGSWTNLSDENIKTDLAPIENGIEKIKQVRTVTGRFITDDESVRRAFLIAQDFQTILPEAVVEFEQGKLGLNYTDVIPLLTAALKESIALIESQQSQIDALTARIEALEAGN